MMFGLLPRDTIDYIITITIQLKLLSFHYSVVRMAFSTLFYSVLRVTKHDRHAISDVLTHPPRSVCFGVEQFHVAKSHWLLLGWPHHYCHSCLFSRLFSKWLTSWTSRLQNISPIQDLKYVPPTPKHLSHAATCHIFIFPPKNRPMIRPN